MHKKRTALAASVLGVAALSSLALQGTAQADLAPQPKDVVTVGSDIQQNAFNFLADGYAGLPGYNTAGNRWRFVNFDSSGDANGRTAYVDPSTAVNYDANLDGAGGNESYVKLSDIKVLNPTISLAAGAPNEVRPSGGNGGITALLNDGSNDWVDVARSPNLPTSTQGSTAAGTPGVGTIHTVQIGIDKDLIAAADVTNAPTTLTLRQVALIYRGFQADGTTPVRTWKDLDPTWPDETIIPLIPPTSAGMRDVFLRRLAQSWGITTYDQDKTGFVSQYVKNPNIRTVQQNDPTVITGLTDASIRKNAIVPFPLGRYTLLKKSYYANPNAANSYTSTGVRAALGVSGLKLLVADPAHPEVAQDASADTDAFAVDFPYNAIFRESDFQSTTPWQPGSTLNWVKALFYNPGGPTPFVQTEAGQALLREAGITPDFEDKDTPHN